MAIVEQDRSFVYTDETTRLVPPTERIGEVKKSAPLSIGALTIIAVALILFISVLVLRVNSHAYAVLAAFGVAGFVYVAFGRGHAT